MDPQDPHFLFPGVPYHLPFAITDRYQEVRMVYQVAVLLGIVLWTGLAPYRQLLCAVFQLRGQPGYEDIELVVVLPAPGHSARWDVRSRKRLEQLLKICTPIAPPI